MSIVSRSSPITTTTTTTSTMLRTIIRSNSSIPSRSISTYRSSNPACILTPLAPASRRTLATTSAAARSSPTSTMPPPEKKMVVFPRATTSFPSEFSEFRHVLWTGVSSQLVAMTIPVGGEIGEEVHHVDQHLIFTSGSAKAIVAGEEREVKAGDLVIVPQGTKHNFINSGPNPLSLFTVYAPPEHNEKSVHKTREEGDELEDAGKDEPPEWADKRNE